MATIDLACPRLTLVSNPSESVVFTVATGVQAQTGGAGEDRFYGDNRVMGVSAGPTQKQFQVTAELVAPEDRAMLEAWVRQLVCYRDDAGAKVFGWYRQVIVDRHSYDPDCAVQFALTQLTYDESA